MVQTRSVAAAQHVSEGTQLSMTKFLPSTTTTPPDLSRLRIAGPVRIRLRRVVELKDPLLVVHFEEFPRLRVPVAYWLPLLRVDVDAA